MPKKKSSLTLKRVLALLLAYVMLCFAGGVVTSLLLLPAAVAVNNTVKATLPSLSVEGIDFDVTSLPQKSTIYASDGKTVIASFYAQNREVVPIKNISSYMQKAVVAREDKRFFEHNGVDVQGVLRAFVQTYIKKGDTQGGSTLTQQYVKNVLLVQAQEDNDPIAEYNASEDTVARKIREMLIAVQMERKYTKAEILQGYLNIAQFGRNSLYGVETAAKRYFNVSAKDLNVAQSATIAAITKNPAQYDPSVESNQPATEKQRNIVLDLMYQQGYITKKQHDEAKATPLVKTLNIQSVELNSGCQSAGDSAYFCDYVTNKILNSTEFGKTRADRVRLLNQGGLKIYSTMDVNANSTAMKTARETIPVNDSSGFEVVIAAVQPGTGKVLGFGINRTYDATDAARTDPTKTAINYAVDEDDGGGQGFPVGSTWKPINMVAWMLAGHSINESLTTSTVYNLSKFDCGTHKFSGYWSVHNADGYTVSPESPFLALVRSHNTTQASIASTIGLCAIASTAKTLGYHNSPSGEGDIYSNISFNAPMVIGAVQASPLTMANVYATIAANGVECTPIAMTKVLDGSGNQLKVPSANCHQAIPSEVAQTTAYAMNQGVVRPDGVAQSTQLDNNRKTFAKTGTNEENYMLTGGFVPQVASFVAVGNAEHQVDFTGKTINGVTHSTWYGEYIAAPAWKKFMDTYLKTANISVNNNYGTPASKFLKTSSSVG